MQNHARNTIVPCYERVNSMACLHDRKVIKSAASDYDEDTGLMHLLL